MLLSRVPAGAILLFVASASVLFAACTGQSAPDPEFPDIPAAPEGSDPQGVELPEGDPDAEVPEGFHRAGLTNLLEPDDGSGRLLFTEQIGRVLTLPRYGWRELGSTPDVFLDIRDRVHAGFWEEGLLDFAFHPQFADNGYFYVHYSRPALSVISRFELDPDDPSRGDPDSETVVLEVPQPHPNHNGGQLAFGPDGYLYIGLGDGGGEGDEDGNSQNPSNLLGTILRIDVDRADEGRNYAVPPDNPFVGDPVALDEIWAYGFRNPWRFSFDSETGALWVADVGQNVWESIHIVEPGRNYGWNIIEGGECYPPGSECDTSGLEMPLHTYRLHAEGDCSVTGGHVYRGRNFPGLLGAYVFGDFCSGRVWGLTLDGLGTVQSHVLAETGLPITSFGVDLDGELYMVTHEGGIYGLTLEPPAAEPPPVEAQQPPEGPGQAAEGMPPG